MRFFATCKIGLESTVAFELRRLGIEVGQVSDARVPFSGDENTMCRALLWLRTAERVLLEVGCFHAESFDELFEGTKKLDWKRFLSPNTNIHVNGKSAKSTLFAVSDCQSIVKKAIVENLKSAYRVQQIPETGSEVIVEVGLLRNEATLALDCCGAGLSRRGYRTYNVAAPLSETLGAAIVSLMRFRPDTPLIDPMCGSGTMPIEAAMIATNRAPGLGRSFSSETWAFLPPAAWRSAREEALDSIQDVPVNILGSDIDPHCIDLCKKHAKKAGVMLSWQVKPVAELTKTGERGILVCNPPYGERLLDPKAIKRLYGEMRQAFDACPDWAVGIFSGVADFERIYGKRADKRRKLSNGGMQCHLYQYFAQRSAT